MKILLIATLALLLSACAPLPFAHLKQPLPKRTRVGVITMMGDPTYVGGTPNFTAGNVLSSLLIGFSELPHFRKALPSYNFNKDVSDRLIKAIRKNSNYVVVPLEYAKNRDFYNYLRQMAQSLNLKVIIAVIPINADAPYHSAWDKKDVSVDGYGIFFSGNTYAYAYYLVDLYQPGHSRYGVSNSFAYSRTITHIDEGSKFSGNSPVVRDLVRWLKTKVAPNITKTGMMMLTLKPPVKTLADASKGVNENTGRVNID